MTGQKWNTTYDDAKYEGWMFGGVQGAASTSKALAQTNQTNSEIKTAVDVWYKSNIVDTGYNSYVHDTIFCNDRSFGSKNIGTGYGASVTIFGAWGRSGISSEPTTPQFTCPQDNDKFTVGAENDGNGSLTYPVGLITADEIIASGSGKYLTANQKYYLYKDLWYWSFSPSSVGSPLTYVFDVNANGALDSNNVSNSREVAPVINLKPEYLNQLCGGNLVTSV